MRHTYATRQRQKQEHPFGTKLTREKRRRRCDYRNGNAIPGGGTSNVSIVMAAQLMEIIEPALAEIVEEEKADFLGSKDYQNGTMTFAHRTAGYSASRTPGAVVRRLFAMRRGAERTADFGLADEMCLAAGNPYGAQQLHMLPRNARGAREIVNGWAEARKLTLTEAELEEIAAETLEVSRALWHRPNRTVTCSRQAFEAIGGERSKWLTTS